MYIIIIPVIPDPVRIWVQNMWTDISYLLLMIDYENEGGSLELVVAGLQVIWSNNQSCTWSMVHTKIHLISFMSPALL